MFSAAPLRHRVLDGLAGHGLRQAVESYLKLLAGTFGRLGLQALYFLILANTLSLPDMGIFASASAAGLMLASFSGLGFGGLAFRAAAGRPRLLGHYMALFYGSLCLTAPLALLAAIPVHGLLFAGAIPLWAFLAILAVEIVLWRLVELQQQLNNGLGLYATGSATITAASAIRTGGAVLFALSGGGDAVQWAVWYGLSNGAALALVWLAFRPRITLRWRMRLFWARLRDSVMFSISYFALNAQGQVDKLLVLSLADPRFVGLYAIATRLIEFTAIPFRAFYVMYTRKLLAHGNRVWRDRRGILKVEAAIFALSTLGFGAAVLLLWCLPDLLGENIAAALPLFGVMLLVPAFRNLMEFHGELFFVRGRLTVRAFIAVGLVLINIAALAAVLAQVSGPAVIGLWLNAVFGGLYLLSALTVFFLLRTKP